jgi:fimbrial isopeptide formation D2 family protein
VLEDFAYGSLNTCPDLKMEKTPDSASYFVGDQFNWNLKVSNSGAGASNVVVTDTVPSGLEIVGTPTFDVDPNTAGGTGNCGVAGQLVTCNIGALAASDGNTTGAEPDVATVTIKVKALATAIPAGTDAACATVNNTGSVSANREQASTSGDNTDTGSVSICRLAASKNANPSFARSWTWQVDKVATGSDGTLTLDAGQSFLQEYKVTYTASSQDSGYAVDGTITITNPASIAATINSVSDVVTVGINASVDCNGGTAGDGLPATVPANGTLNCSYHAGLPDATTRTNTATATQQNYDYSSGSAVASGTTDYSTGAVSVNFAGVVPTETDESIVASDTFTSSLPAGATLCTGLNTPVTGCLAGSPPSGTVNAADSPKTFTYYVFIGPFAAADCGEHNIDNTASFVTNDTATTGSDSNHIVVTVPCQQGCTLTQGYWKTHSIYGPAPTDDAWNNIPASPYAPDDGDGVDENQDETFFKSGATWYQVFWIAPKGNAYYILAHQYEAAVLNVLNGSDPSAITATLNSALTLLSSYTPAQVKASSSLRTQAITLAGILASYNEGLIGPGHCDEDQLSSRTE